MFVDITKDGSGSGVEITESDAKVFCKRGSMAEDDSTTEGGGHVANGLKGAPVMVTSMDAARWGLAWNGVSNWKERCKLHLFLRRDKEVGRKEGLPSFLHLGHWNIGVPAHPRPITHLPQPAVTTR